MKHHKQMLGERRYRTKSIKDYLPARLSFLLSVLSNKGRLPGMQAHVYNLSILEAETGGML